MVNAPGLLALRIWIIMISTTMIGTMIPCYIRLSKYGTTHGYSIPLQWKDWTTMALSSIIFLTYIYAILGKPILHKYLRAFSILILSGFLLYLNIELIVLEFKKSINIYNTYNYGYYSSFRADIPFSCSQDYRPCIECWAYRFISIGVGCSILVDIIFSFLIGPVPSWRETPKQDQEIELQTRQVPQTTLQAPIDQVQQPNPEISHQQAAGVQ